MNIFNKVALQGLIKNRTRTVVTIIGVALAAALFTGVATFAVSLQDYMVRGAEGKYGSWHLEVFQADTSFAEQQAGNSKVAQAVSFENIGYAILEGGQNADKPYLFLAGFHEDTFSVLPVNLLYGRLPENSGEVLVSSHVENNGGVKFSVGDTLTLPVGERQTDGRVLSQHDPFQGGEETLAATEVKTYTVVGICQRPAFEMRSAPGYTLITKADGSTPAESQTVFLALKEPAQSRSFAKNSLVGCVYTQNDDVLRFLGASDDTLFNTLLYSIGGVLLILIMTGSVFMIYNSFNISLSERTHQFGILMSVGATARQLRGSVLFEGLCIGVIGIPLGILLGIPSIKLVLDLVSKNFSNIMYDNVALALRLSVPALIGAAVVSLITILISAYIPAKKAAAMPVMECIRQTNEIKVDAKSMRPSRLSRRFLGLDETLALKNFKRNKGRYRSIILSLTFSVVLFVGSSYFKTCFVTLSNQAKVVTDFDINLDAPAMTGEDLTALCDHLKGAAGVTHASCRTTLECTGTVPANALTDAYWQAAGQQPPVDSVDLVATVMILSDDFYEQIVKNLGLSVEEYTGPTGKRIAVGKMEASGYVEGPDDLSDMFASSSLHVTLTPWDGDGLKLESTEVEAELFSFVPPDSASTSGSPTPVPYFFEVLIPWSMRESVLPEGSTVLGKGIAFCSDTTGQTTAAIRDILPELGVTGGYSLYNFHQMLDESRNMLFIVNLFTIVFVAMISLIAVTNVFNTISTNIKLRRRELAMLRSVGMADRDFDRMMRFECALYGLRTLLFGLPLSLLVSWLIYFGLTFKETEAFPFQFPWASLGISMVGVFIVIFITMLYATSKIRKENIIDSLRDEMT